MRTASSRGDKKIVTEIETEKPIINLACLACDAINFDLTLFVFVFEISFEVCNLFHLRIE